MKSEIERISHIIVNDVREFYTTGPMTKNDEEKMNVLYLHLIQEHNEKRLNLFEYNDDMFYDLFV
jgi:hypothetical protein